MDANAEVTKDTLGHYTHLYYAGGDAYTAPAVMVIDETGQTTIYQITRDNLGSAIQYAGKNGVRYRYSYSPWGVRTHQVGGNTVFYQSGDDSPFGPFYRTYTGHEDLWMFGLLNANARLYNPYLGRFISPDPLLNSEGGPLLYNPYIYANNNPFKYIDRNGEFFWLVAILGCTALAAGGANVAYNWDKIHSFGDALGYFGTGAGYVGKMALYAGATVAGFGLVTAGIIYGGPVIAAGLGIAGTTAGAIAGASIAGTICGGLHYFYQAGLDSWYFGTPFEVSWSGCLTEAAITGATAGFCKYLSIKTATRAEKSNIMSQRPTMTEPDKLSPLPSDDLPVYSQPDPKDIIDQAKSMAGRGNSTVYVGKDENGYIRYVGRTDRNPEIRFGEHYRSGRMTSTLQFEPITTTLDHNGSRIIEQEFINKYGMQKNGGQLFNKINSLSPKQWEKFGIK